MNKRRGFTLIELMVSIGIIALLVAILIPAITSVHRQARTTHCLANLRQLEMAFRSYTIHENQGRSIYYNSPAVLWLPELRHSGAVAQVRLCPEALDISAGVGNATTSWTYGVANPAYPPGYNSGSYAFNGWLYTPTAPPIWGAPTEYIVLQGATRTDETPLLADSIWVDAWPQPNDPVPANLNLGTKSNPDEMGRVCIDRHHRAINVVFLDGHAGTFQLQELWGLRWSQNYVPPVPLPTIP